MLYHMMLFYMQKIYASAQSNLEMPLSLKTEKHLFTDVQALRIGACLCGLCFLCCP